MSQDINLNAYFERIGFSGSIAPNLATLEALHLAHPTAIAFENLTPFLNQPVPLDAGSLQEKLIVERRGGYCFEHNLLFLEVLRELDYTVTGHAARVLWNHPEGAIRPRSHMLMSVEIGGATYLADVGFGGLTMTAPLKLKTEVEQPTPHETFRLTGGESEYRLEAKIGEDWRPLYAFDLGQWHEIDFESPNFYLSRHPDSQFRKRLIAARPEKGRRHALVDNTLSTHITGGETERRILTSVEEIREVLSGVFGINLPADERLDPAIERMLVPATEPVD